MTWMPFLCLSIGLVFGIRDLPSKVLEGIDRIINFALIVLMLTIGSHIGINDSVMSNLPFIGIHCVVISLSAILFSVILTVLAEKTILPLEELKERLFSENLNVNQEVSIEAEENKKKHHP